eukprot:1068616-Pelagomonas_calceolata.AAC.4
MAVDRGIKFKGFLPRSSSSSAVTAECNSPNGPCFFGSVYAGGVVVHCSSALIELADLNPGHLTTIHRGYEAP